MIRAIGFFAFMTFVVGEPARAAEIGKAPCEPQPECRVVTTPLVPGAPTIGIRGLGKTLEDTSKVFDKVNKDAGRDTLRLPQNQLQR